MVNLRYILAQSIKLTVAIVTLSLLIFAVWALWQPEPSILGKARHPANRFILHPVPVQLEGGILFRTRELEPKTYDEQWASGDVWLVNFWTTWCGPCRQEMPYLTDLARRYGPQGLQFMPVSQDFQADGDAAMVAFIEDFYRRQRMDWPVYLYEGNAKEAFKMIGMPTTLIIDRQGRERARMVGAFYPEAEQEAEALIQRLLAEPRPTSEPNQPTGQNAVVWPAANADAQR